jgi:hypothetical protein
VVFVLAERAVDRAVPIVESSSLFEAMFRAQDMAFAIGERFPGWSGTAVIVPGAEWVAECDQRVYVVTARGES